MAADVPVYHSFDDVPLDVPPLEEGDDSLHAHDLGAGGAVFLAPPTRTLPLGPQPRQLIIPHPRDLRKGMKGKDVLALQRALSRAGYHSWNLRTGQFGDQLEKDVKRFQQKTGLHVDGVYGTATHAKLARWYTLFEINLILQVKVETPQQKAQRLFIAASMYLYNVRGRVHYTQGWSRMSIVKWHLRALALLQGAGPLYEDCSSLMTGLYYVAGVPDPNDFGYNGLGYTGTMAVRGQRHYGTQPVGACGFYGSYPFGHVVGALNVGTIPRVITHGSEPGPLVLLADYRGLPAQWRTYPGIHW